MLGHLGSLGLGLMTGWPRQLEERVYREAGREIRSVLGRGKGDAAHSLSRHRPQERGVGAWHVGERGDRGHALRRSAGSTMRTMLWQTLIGWRFVFPHCQVWDQWSREHKTFHCFSPSSEPINHGAGTNHSLARTNNEEGNTRLNIILCLCQNVVGFCVITFKVSLAVVRRDSETCSVTRLSITKWWLMIKMNRKMNIG